jgi:hypothetical protein
MTKKQTELFKPPKYKRYIYKLTPAMRKWLLTQHRTPFGVDACSVLLNIDVVPPRFKPQCSKQEYDGRS